MNTELNSIADVIGSVRSKYNLSLPIIIVESDRGDGLPFAIDTAHISGVNLIHIRRKMISEYLDFAEGNRGPSQEAFISGNRLFIVRVMNEGIVDGELFLIVTIFD